MGIEEQSPSKTEEASGKSFGEMMHDIRLTFISLLSRTNLGYQKLKAMMPTAAFHEGNKTVISPIQDLKQNIQQGVLCYSQHINKNYPFMSSMAKAHQSMLTAQVGIGSGIIATVALKSIVKRRVRLFVGVSALMALDTYALCELCKFQEHQNRAKVKET